MKLSKIMSLAGCIFYLLVSVQFAQPQANLVATSLEKSILKAESGSEIKVFLTAKIQTGWHINSHKPNDEFLIPTTIISNNKLFPISKIIFPKPIERKLSVSDKPVSVFEGESKFQLIFKIDKAASAGSYKILIEFGYQGCNDETCMPPSSSISELVIDVKAITQSSEEKSLDTAKSKSPDSQIIENKNESKIDTIASKDVKREVEVSLSEAMEKQGLFLSLLIVFLGGLALNLTPCVYPLIPITIGYFGGQTEGKTSRLFLLGVLYVIGIAITYSVVGVVTALSGAMFGSLLQQPIVIVIICLIFIALALSMFGVYEFKLPDSWTMKAGGARSGIAGAFFMGLTMGIVAAPCIGPFVLSLVTVVAAKGDPFYGFMMFFVLAVGLGMPYLVLALFSGKLKSLPRAGLWMEAVKHIFGFIMIGMALYYAGPLLPKVFNHYMLPVYGIAAALYLMIFDKTADKNKGFKRFKTTFSLVIIALSVYALWPVNEVSLNWKKYNLALYNESKNKKEKIIIDFSAEWCVPCRELDAQTFSNEKVIEAGKEFTCFKADMTKSGSDETEALRKQFNVIGVPTVLIFDSEGKESARITGFVNAGEFLKLMNRAD